jgi:glutamyl-Q tRNA(Asp) synthetase
LVAALASWLDARSHRGRWLVRIEDVDTPRCVPGADTAILAQLDACGLRPDEAPLYQSARGALYEAALQQLIAQGRAYPCGCTRQDIAQALAGAGQLRERHGELVYPGTCRHGLQGKTARAWRFVTQAGALVWNDRHSGPQSQDVSTQVGDFVLNRADGLWAYQLAVVVDDAAQGVSHVVRGQDLADNSARQIQLQRALGLPTPQYLHTPLVLGANGEKLSKQNGAQALELSEPLKALNAAAGVLGLDAQAGPVADALTHWTQAWAERHGH